MSLINNIDAKQITVTTPGTAVQLFSENKGGYVIIKALPTNSGYIYMGKSDVDSTKYVMEAGNGISVVTDILTQLYIDADNGGEGVCILWGELK